MQLARAARTLPALAFICCVAAATAGGAQAAPSVTIKSPVDGATLSATARQMLVQSPPGSRLMCRIDNGRRRACRRRVVLRHLRDGLHRATVTAVAPNGVASKAATRFRIDTKPPVVTILSPGPGQVFADTATATFTANEQSTFTCRVDFGDADPCTSPVSSDEIPDGRHVLTVVARDRAGNAGSASVEFAVDRSAAGGPDEADPEEPAGPDPDPDPGPSEPGPSPTTEPTAPTSGPTAPTSEPTAPTSEPTAPISGPTLPTTEPTAPTSGPTLPAPEPTVPTSGPTAPTTEPTAPTSEPTGPTTTPPPPDPNPEPNPAPTPTPSPSAQATALDGSHIRIVWQPPAGAASVEIVRRDLVDSTPDMVVATISAAAGSFTDAQLWYANSYRHTLAFKDAGGATLTTLTTQAATSAVTPATFPVPFASSPHIGNKLGAQTAMASSTDTARYRNYVVGHIANANLTLRSYGIPVYEAKTTTRLIGPFNCGYNCQLPRSGAASVPLPTKPKPVGILGLDLMADKGSDHHMSVVSANGATIWDFFRPDEDNTDVDKTNPAVWQFVQAGATFQPKATTPAIAAPSNYAAANAANFANLAGLIRPEELALGEIRHALMMSVPGIGSAGATGTNLPACPATHNALVKDPLTGATNLDAPPEGLRFRLNPAFNVATLSRPWERIVAKAMQDYGVFVRDNGGTVSVYAETTSLNTTTGDTRGGRGYDGWNKAKAGLSTTANSAGFSSAFPWNQLEVVAFTPGPSCA